MTEPKETTMTDERTALRQWAWEEAARIEAHRADSEGTPMEIARIANQLVRWAETGKLGKVDAEA